MPLAIGSCEVQAVGALQNESGAHVPVSMAAMDDETLRSVAHSQVPDALELRIKELFHPVQLVDPTVVVTAANAWEPVRIRLFDNHWHSQRASNRPGRKPHIWPLKANEDQRMKWVNWIGNVSAIAAVSIVTCAVSTARRLPLRTALTSDADGVQGRGMDLALPTLRRISAGLLTLFLLPLPGQSRELGRQDFASNLRREVMLEGVGAQRFSIEERMRHYAVPAVSVAVVEGCEVVEARAFGAAKPDGTPAQMDTRFMAGSVSKVVAAVGALKLAEQGVLSLDEDVTRHLGSWTLTRSAHVGQDAVTVRHLLSHSAGLTVPGFKGYPQGAALPRSTDILDGKEPANTPPVRIEATPGSTWRYSGGGFVLLQYIMEQASGKAFKDVIRKRVLNPAGMVNSAYGSPTQTHHGSDAAAGTLANGDPIPGGWRLYPEYAAAGLWSTPTDLSRLGIELVRSLRGERHTVLRADTVKEMLRQHAGAWGLGIELSPKGAPPKISHTGAPVGYRTLWMMFPETCQGATIMTNADEGMTLAYEVARALADQYRWPDPMSSERAKSIPLTNDVAHRFVGTYQLRDFPTERFEIDRAADGTLTWSRQGRGRRTLAAASERMLFSPDSGMSLVALDPKPLDPASTVELRFGGGVNVAQRIARDGPPGLP